MKTKYLFLLFLGYASCTSNTETGLQITVDAGEFDRQNTVVTFQAPDNLKHEFYELLDAESHSVPVQVEGKNISFILPELNSGERISLRLLPSNEKNEKGISIQLFEDAVAFISEDNQPVLHYRSGGGGQNLGGLDERFRRGGYLHPVYTPAGQVVTGHYHPDRPHQLGIWSGWSRTVFEGRNPEFWYPVSERGAIEVFSLDKIWRGPVHGGIHTQHHFIDKTADEPSPVLSEMWAVQVYNVQEIYGRALHIFDLDAEQQNITQNPFTFNEHVYGGISFRGNDAWLGEENTRLLTSEGKTRVDGAPIRDVWSHVEAHQSRAKWAYISGVTNDERPGIVILVHPENLNFPEPIFMNLREPFFAFSPSVMGDITLEPGESLRFRYRYVVMDGEPDAEFLENLWLDYAHPAEVTLN